MVPFCLTENASFIEDVTRKTRASVSVPRSSRQRKSLENRYALNALGSSKKKV